MQYFNPDIKAGIDPNQHKNSNGKYSFSLGNQQFSNVPMVEANGTQYFDIGQHMYYGNNGWSLTGAKSQQMTKESIGLTKVSPYTHSGKFRIEAVDGISTPLGSLGQIDIISDIDAVTGFWNTRATTELAYSFGVMPTVGFADVMTADITVLEDTYATSLVDWANKSGLISISSIQALVNHTSFKGQTPNRSETIWEASGFGFGFSVGYSGSSSLNTFKEGDFYYSHIRRPNEVVLGLTTKDSVIRAANDPTIPNRSEFMERHCLTEEDLKKYRNKN